MQLHHSDNGIGLSVTFYEFFYDSFMTILFPFFVKIYVCVNVNATQQTPQPKYEIMECISWHCTTTKPFN